MNDEYLDELLDRLGYRGGRKDAFRRYLAEYQRRKRVLEQGELDSGDILVLSIIFDGFNRAAAEKRKVLK